RVEPLLDPFRVAFREPPFLDEAVHSFRQQVHIRSPASIQIDDSSGSERRLVSHLTACSGAGTAGEVDCSRNIDIWTTHATEAVPQSIDSDDVLRRSRIRYGYALSAWSGNSLLHPLIQVIESRVENESHEAGLHQRNFRLAFGVKRPVD